MLILVSSARESELRIVHNKGGIGQCHYRRLQQIVKLRAAAFEAELLVGATGQQQKR